MTTDIPICGFASITGLCLDPRAERQGAIRCTTHDDPRFMVCAGCAGLAHRECAMVDNCASAVCMTCVHYAGNAGHGPLMEKLVETKLDVRPAEARITQDVRKELISVVADVLRECEGRALVSFPDAEHATRVAGVVLDGLMVHTTLKVLSGLTGAQE